jgi:tetratricopeptide (TPR) repeat protein
LQQKNMADAQSALQRFVRLRLAEDSASKTDTATDAGLMQAYFLLADIADQSQKTDEAEHYLALIDSPQDAIRVQSRRAAILARQGKLDEARALIRAAPETQEADARTKVNAELQLLRDNKQFGLAYALLQQAVQREPADVDLRYDLAMAAEKLDKVDEMEKLLRQVIADKPDYHHAYNALGYSLADRKLRLPEARELVKKALEFAPNDPFILDSLGWVEFRSGNLDQALEILQGAFQARPDAEIAAHLGEVMWAMGQQAQARAVWKAAVLQSPENDTLLQTIKRLSPL